MNSVKRALLVSCAASPVCASNATPRDSAAAAWQRDHKSSFQASALGRASRIVDHATADETAAKKLALDVTALRAREERRGGERGAHARSDDVDEHAFLRTPRC